MHQVYGFVRVPAITSEVIEIFHGGFYNYDQYAGKSVMMPTGNEFLAPATQRSILSMYRSSIWNCTAARVDPGMP